MIDEKKLIEDIEKEFDGVCVYDVSPSQAVNDFVEIVDRQPEVGQWIPVSERLPPIDMSYPNANDYLVYYEHGYYDVASYSNINRFWHEHTTEPYWNCGQYCKVVAWMSLPEPYKESED